MSQVTHPKQMIQTVPQWYVLRAFAALGSPISYNALEAVREECELALEAEEFTQIVSTLHARGILEQGSDIGLMASYYGLSPAGSAALKALRLPPHPWLTAEELIELLSNPPQFPSELGEVPRADSYPPAAQYEASWSDAEYAFENGWDESQSVLKSWMRDVSRRIRD